MSTNPREIQQAPPPKPKQAEGSKLSRGSKDQEIENLKRLLANISQRLEQLK